MAITTLLQHSEENNITKRILADTLFIIQCFGRQYGNIAANSSVLTCSSQCACKALAQWLIDRVSLFSKTVKERPFTFKEGSI